MLMSLCGGVMGVDMGHVQVGTLEGQVLSEGFIFSEGSVIFPLRPAV